MTRRLPWGRRRSALLAGALALAIGGWPRPAIAHDPSAWGGLFRSRDLGVTWLPIDEGRFIGGAIALAISPTDPHHLLLATDAGLLRSRNGGRDWVTEAPTVFIGPVFAVAFDRDGQRVLASTASALFRTDDGVTWRNVGAPAGSTPARAIVADADGAVYLAGPGGLRVTRDWGDTWASAGEELEDQVDDVLVERNRRDSLYTLVSGRVWHSADGGRSWEPRDNGLPEGRIEALVQDADVAGRWWAAGADRVFRSENGGGRWAAVGQPLSEPDTPVRGIAATGQTIVVTTHRGVIRSWTGGESWELIADNLPVHLEAGPLARDPSDRATLYAGFAVTPYPELWRLGTEGGTVLSRLNPISLAGGVAFLAVLVIAGGAAVRWLTRRTDSTIPAGSPSARATGPPR